MKYIIKQIAVDAAVGALLVGTLAEAEQAHAEYQAVTPSTTVDLLLSGGMTSNVASSTVSVIRYSPAALNLESLVPHDHLVIQTASLVPYSEDTSLDNHVSKVQRSAVGSFWEQQSRLTLTKRDSFSVTQRRDFHARRIEGRRKRQ